MAVLVKQDVGGLQVTVHDITPAGVQWLLGGQLGTSFLSRLPMHMFQSQNDFRCIEFHLIFIENSMLKNAFYRTENPKVWLVLIVWINIDGRIRGWDG